MNKKADKRFTVLHVIDSLPLEGAEMLLYDLIQQGDRRRFSYLVCALTKGGGVVDLLREMDIPVYILGRKSFWDLGAFRRLVRLMIEKNVDIVHTHLFSSHLWGRMAARRAGVLVIFSTEHNLSEWKGSWRRTTDRFTSHFVDVIIAVSQPVKRSLISTCRVRPEKVVVIENGLNFQRLEVEVNREEKLRELGLSSRIKLVGTAAALTPKKGHRYLFEAARIILDRGEDVYFLLMGEGELRKEFQAKIRKDKLQDRVRLLGSRRDAVEIMSLLDVFVMSSIREGLSIALLEAMALGRAVVVTAVGGAPEVVEDGISGLLVPSANPIKLAEAIEKVLHQPELAKKLGKNARNEVRSRYNLARTVRQYEALYTAALAGGGAKA